MKAVESIIVDPRTGIPLTDFDVILERHIVEVTGGDGAGKMAQIRDNIKPLTNKEVVLFAPKIGKFAKRSVEAEGVKVFTKTDDLVKYINGK